ncbi:hypothetical protein RB200_21615 [Streptomyces sp. PmtG]
MRKLAERSEGRHICYRAYVQDEGWQKPVCDGAEAGTVGQGKPIRSLNIAVSGTNGVSGSAAYVVEHWREGDAWKKAEDEQDLYLGDKESNHPMQGLTLQVFDGSTCFRPYAKDAGWIEQPCTEPGQWRYAGARMEDDLQLEAIRLTV